MLPDMLDSAASSGTIPADEHTTNLVTSIFTTAFNAGGIVGPVVGAVGIPWLGSMFKDEQEDRDVVGFRASLGCFAAAFLLLGLLIFATEVVDRYSGYHRVSALDDHCSSKLTKAVAPKEMKLNAANEQTE
eukprot:SAG31_NODE_5129_length_2724_cov_2.380571_2_plen_131_part_00